MHFEGICSLIQEHNYPFNVVYKLTNALISEHDKLGINRHLYMQTRVPSWGLSIISPTGI